MSEGIWTMTESEFAGALLKAKAEAWTEGANVAWAASGEGFNGEYPDYDEPFSAVMNPYALQGYVDAVAEGDADLYEAWIEAAN